MVATCLVVCLLALAARSSSGTGSLDIRIEDAKKEVIDCDVTMQE